MKFHEISFRNEISPSHTVSVTHICSHERLYIPRHRTQITLALLYRTAVRLYLYPAVLQLYHYNVTAQLQVQLYSSNPIIAHLEASSVLSDWERPQSCDLAEYAGDEGSLEV